MLNSMKNDRLIKMHENAWTMNYLFPERYKGAKIPEMQPVMSNTMTMDMDRTVPVHEGSFLAIFSPLIETCSPYFTNTGDFLPVGDIDQYIVYADSNGMAYNVVDGELINLKDWNYRKGPSLTKLSSYKKIRIVGACMEISVHDITKNYAGIVETCLNFEVMGNGLKNDRISINKMENNPGYKVFKANEPFILKYRYNNEKYIDFGPYEPYSVFPVHIVKATGLSSTASVKVKTIIHIEGVLMPELAHFSTNEIVQQKPRKAQASQIDVNDEDYSSKKDEADDHHHRTQNNMYFKFDGDDDRKFSTFNKIPGGASNEYIGSNTDENDDNDPGNYQNDRKDRIVLNDAASKRKSKTQTENDYKTKQQQSPKIKIDDMVTLTKPRTNKGRFYDYVNQNWDIDQTGGATILNLFKKSTIAPGISRIGNTPGTVSKQYGNSFDPAKFLEGAFSFSKKLMSTNNMKGANLFGELLGKRTAEVFTSDL